mmetsp:Transcript_28293/g.67258  ORF Transcript_28293/g.67258 Transcript_28293/m.67258 type:complete len:292 (+) Transcript_28293:162-1037(+)|eukprot:CAMPEP_0177589692 /NCGR_PEP_ID=MMETSP0419_2-20121207/6961_1 /TAXON_ID=582737 /ORGANISM="Tetraselmis sp., Strain GSL018" /LENGTH=291 /DNA_ID=CAMNT_0019080107 /DNA_START=95 /DNA_END=970 /DNA_ORIENTATION=-
MSRTLFKTKLCALWMRGNCYRERCTFAHGEAELRKPHFRKPFPQQLSPPRAYGGRSSDHRAPGGDSPERDSGRRERARSRTPPRRRSHSSSEGNGQPRRSRSPAFRRDKPGNWDSSYDKAGQHDSRREDADGGMLARQRQANHDMRDQISYLEAQLSTEQNYEKEINHEIQCMEAELDDAVHEYTELKTCTKRLMKHMMRLVDATDAVQFHTDKLNKLIHDYKTRVRQPGDKATNNPQGLPAERYQAQAAGHGDVDIGPGGQPEAARFRQAEALQGRADGSARGDEQAMMR